jgi:glutathione S-transferase
MNLHCFLGDANTSKILACASFCGVKINLNIVKPNDLRTKEFKKKLLLQKLPILDIDDNTSIAESSAIVRYLASSKPECYGKTPYGMALTDQWLEVVECSLEAPALVLTALLQGNVGYDKDAQKKATEDFLKTCGIIDQQLGKTKFLTGDAPTIADYTLASVLISVLRVGLSGNSIGKLSHLKAWLEGMTKCEHIVQTMGRVKFCDKPFEVPPAEEEGDD